MMQKLKGIKQASGATKNNSPFVFSVWFDTRRNRVFTINDSYDYWINEYKLLGYIKLLEDSRHFTMKEINQRIEEYFTLKTTWEQGLS